MQLTRFSLLQWMATLVTRIELSLACLLLCPLEMERKVLLLNLLNDLEDRATLC